jgi:hypothetical protein
MHRMEFHLDSGQTSAVKTKHGLGDDLARLRSRHPSMREVPGMYKGCTRDTQGIPKGPTRSQYRSNPGATPEQHACSRLAAWGFPGSLGPGSTKLKEVPKSPGFEFLAGRTAKSALYNAGSACEGDA